MRPASRGIRNNRRGATEKELKPSKQVEPGRQNMDMSFWKAALEAYPDALTVHSSDGTLVFANEKMVRVSNRGRDEMEGKGCAELFHEGEVVCPHEEVLESGKRHSGEKPFKLGGRQFKLVIEPIRNEEGQVAGYMRVMRDVTGAHKLREQLLKAEQLATLGQMVNGLAHDIGTPLNIISGYSEYLLMRSVPEAQGRNEISTILQQTRRIAGYVKQMLDLARPSPIRTDAIDLNDFLADSLDLISHQLRKTDVKASVECLASSPVIYGDASRLRQAFFNLLFNACPKVGAGGSINLMIDRSGDDSEFISVALFGADASGTAHDFSGSLSGLLSPDCQAVSEELGLTLAREAFDRLSAKIISSDAGSQGMHLVVKLPIRGLNEATAHGNK